MITEHKTSSGKFVWLDNADYASGKEEYPAKFLNRIQSSELMVMNVPEIYVGLKNHYTESDISILDILKKIGQQDLSVGRIFEGHLNAMLLIGKYGTESQKHKYFSQAKDGILFGIWNSEFPSEPLELLSSENKTHLKGAKVFCSGANNIFRPIVTAKGHEGQQMIILNLDDYNLDEDYTYWKPMGMVSSVSCRFDFSGIGINETQFLGSPYAYFDEPDFSGGSVRFAAVQLGGAIACVSATRKHLIDMNRADNSDQIRRMSQLAILIETGNLWLKKIERLYEKRYETPSEFMYEANMFRTIIRDICEQVLSLCEMSVGLQGMMKPHPLERIHRDLSVYLKQPAPDKALSEVGKYFINL